MVLATLNANNDCIVVKRNDIKDKVKLMNNEQINQRKHIQSKVDEINENRIILKNKLNDLNNEWSTKKSDIQSIMRVVKDDFELQSNKITISEGLSKDEKLMVFLKAKEDKIVYFNKLQLLKEELIETNNFYSSEKVKLVEEMSKLKDKETSLKAIAKSIHLQFIKVKDELSNQLAELSGKSKATVVEVIPIETLPIGNDANEAMQITESSYGNIDEPKPKSSSNLKDDKIEILKLLDSIKSKKQFLSESLVGLNTSWNFNKDRYNTKIKLLQAEFEEFKTQNLVCNGSIDDKETYRNLMKDAKLNYFHNVENEKTLFKQLSEDSASKKLAIQDELAELKQQELYFKNVISNMSKKPVEINYNTNNSANSLPVSENVIVADSVSDYSQSYEEVFETTRSYQEEVNEYKELIAIASEKYKKQFNLLVAMNKQWSNKEIIGLDAIKAFDNKKNEIKLDLKEIKNTLESFKFNFKELVANHELKKQWELV